MSEQEKKETMNRAAHDKQNPYAQISREMLHDKNISPKSKGVLCYLLSLPNDWIVHPRQVAESLGVGKDQIYWVIEELIREGYATRQTVKGEKGQFDWVKYEFYEFKILIAVSGKPTGHLSGIPDTGNQPLLKNNSTEKDTTNLKEPEVVVFSDLKISEGLMKSLMKKHSLPELVAAVRRTKAWTDRESDEAAILTCLERQHTWKDESSNSAEENKTYAASLPRYENQFVKMEVFNKTVEFTFLNSVKESIAVEYTEKNFIKKLHDHLKDNGFIQ